MIDFCMDISPDDVLKSLPCILCLVLPFEITALYMRTNIGEKCDATVVLQKSDKIFINIWCTLECEINHDHSISEDDRRQQVSVGVTFVSSAVDLCQLIISYLVTQELDVKVSSQMIGVRIGSHKSLGASDWFDHGTCARNCWTWCIC